MNLKFPGVDFYFIITTNFRELHAFFHKLSLQALKALSISTLLPSGPWEFPSVGHQMQETKG